MAGAWMLCLAARPVCTKTSIFWSCWATCRGYGTCSTSTASPSSGSGARIAGWMGEGERRPTAFVVADGQGRELDVHVIDLGSDVAIVQHYDDPWSFPASIAGQGSIGGAAIPCVSKETQLAMHS